ncbi:hypothetical protein SAMN04487950_0425 [Halogranum rubrum]|uniref:Uncharacterized protein n=1 Tax=Halogranum rubrum TaxID=553466 RepID=A0A1I4BBE8_9EURY|nr:hypothetical protein [Halogranum rubrum]SFK65670.1 hypothetical protein SAMN04487950_0425 [Halogranum rubrum]
MALTAVAWMSMLLAIILLPGVAIVVLVKSMRSEERKLELLQEQGSIDSYSPRALTELREWVQANPNDPYASIARERHNECVRTLKDIDEPYYEWSAEEIEQLEELQP